jgi:hypothetical protein
MSERRGTTSDFPRWYVNFQAAVILALPRPDTIGEDVALGWKDNGESLTRALHNALIPPALKFALLADLGTITVPKDYDHATALATFMARNRRKFYGVNENITDANFANPSRILKPGDKLRVRAFKQVVGGATSSEECMAFLATQKAVHTGAQGASMVFEQKRGQLPKGYWYTSFDEKDRLWAVAGGRHGVPSVNASSGGGFGFGLGAFGGPWHDGCALLCFCDE